MSRGSTTLYVTGFGHGTRARDLAQEFERYGRLVRCDIPAPRNSSSRLFAFVEYESRRDADDAYHEMHKARISHDDILSVEWARTPPSAGWRHDRDGRGPPRRRSPRPRSRTPPRRGYRSPRRDDRRDRDYDRRDRDRDRERSRSPGAERLEDGDREMKDAPKDTEAPAGDEAPEETRDEVREKESDEPAKDSSRPAEDELDTAE